MAREQCNAAWAISARLGYQDCTEAMAIPKEMSMLCHGKNVCRSRHLSQLPLITAVVQSPVRPSTKIEQ